MLALDLLEDFVIRNQVFDQFGLVVVFAELFVSVDDFVLVDFRVLRIIGQFEQGTIGH